eukprot:4327695-Pyramimonas_sp.AAC.1
MPSGDHMIEALPKEEAVEKFKELFSKKSGNQWEKWARGDGARKCPGKFYPLEMDYGKDNKKNAEEMEARLAKEAKDAVDACVLPEQ